MVRPEIIYMQDSAGCIYTFMHLYIYVIITIKENEVMNLKSNGGRGMERGGGKKRKGEKNIIIF